MRFTRPDRIDRTKAVQLNLASMIDVVFLLLVFFIATTTIALPESKLSPALQTRDENAQAPQDLTPQVVRVEMLDQRPVYRLGARVITDRGELTDLLRELPKEIGVFVEVSGRVTVEFAVSAIQSCRDAGFERVTYVPETER